MIARESSTSDFHPNFARSQLSIFEEKLGVMRGRVHFCGHAHVASKKPCTHQDTLPANQNDAARLAKNI
jgi:hypothetical protein